MTGGHVMCVTVDSPTVTININTPTRSIGPRGLELRHALPAPDVPEKAPLLFVHGLGHGAWCWSHWLEAAAAAGHPAYAVWLRGHGTSQGLLRTARLSHYVDDVVHTAASLPRRPVLVGHSLGGLVVQLALARYSARAGVLVAPVPAHPAVGSLLAIARRHPADAARLFLGRSLPLRRQYLFNQLPGPAAQLLADRCGPESPLVQYQLLLHRPAARPRGDAPVLVLATPDDALVPLADVRRTASRYAAPVLTFPGMGHDLMLDGGWRAPFDAMTSWLGQLPPR